MNGRRVCLVCGDFFPSPIGGQGIYTYELARNLTRLGYRVTVITTKRRGLEHTGFEVLPIHFDNLGLFAIESWLRYRKILRNFDVVHGSDFYHLGLLFEKNRPVAFTTIHNTHLQRYRASRYWLRFLFAIPIFLEKLACRCSDRIIAVSETTKGALLEYGLAAGDIQVIHNGIDTTRFNPARRGEFRRTVGIDEDSEVVLFVGRLVQRKRPLEVLVAFHQLYADRPGLHLVMVGSGPLAATLRQYVERHGLGHRVHLLGNLPNEALPEIYADSNLFVLVSSGEGLPLSALEALASGCKLLLTYDASGGARLLREAEQVVEYDANRDQLEDMILRALDGKPGVVDPVVISIETCARKVANLYKEVARAV